MNKQDLLDKVKEKGLSKKFYQDCEKLTDKNVIESRFWFVVSCFK